MPSSDNASTRTRSFQDLPALADRAVELLTRQSGPLPGVAADEARALLSYLRVVSVPRGTALMVEGDQLHTGHLLLVLEGQVGVESQVGQDKVEMAILGPGELIGEVSLLDGGPRTASCSAMTDVQAAALGRLGLQRLMEERPVVAAHLMIFIGQRVAERLRAVDAQLQAYGQLLNPSGQAQGR